MEVIMEEKEVLKQRTKVDEILHKQGWRVCRQMNYGYTQIYDNVDISGIVITHVIYKHGTVYSGRLDNDNYTNNCTRIRYRGVCFLFPP